jgi:hypothetical protein
MYYLHVLSTFFDNSLAKRSYFETHTPMFYKGTRIPRYPILNEDGSFTMSRWQRHIISSLHPTSNNAILYSIEFLFGAIITTSAKRIKRSTASLIPIKFLIKVPPVVAGPAPIYHGWYSRGTRQALEGAIQLYKPTIIVELGVWMGQSAIGICEAAAPRKITYYGFDRFSDTATQPKYVNTPADSFFLEHGRLETTLANLAPYAAKGHELYLTNRNAFKALEFLKKRNIVPDLLFIDFEKSTIPLRTLLHDYKKEFPNLVIVGDDLVGDGVKRAIAGMPHHNFFNAYVMAPTLYPKKDFHPAPYTPMKLFIDTLSKEEQDKIKADKMVTSYFS